MRRAARYAELCVLVLGLVAVVAAIAWSATGGSFYAVKTASMGTAAPVGSLVIDRPAKQLHIGELITFRLPGSGRVFTHRIYAIRPDGRIRTKGDVNDAPDGWIVDRREILGRVVATVRYLGWVLRATPILALGLILVWLLTRWLVVPAWRATMRASGVVLVAVIATTVLNPLTGWAIISFKPGQNGAGGSVVSTGVLPLRVTAVGGVSQTVDDGEIARVATHKIGPKNQYQLRVEPDWQWWWMGPMALLVLLPGFLTLAVDERRLVAERAPAPRPKRAPAPRPERARAPRLEQPPLQAPPALPWSTAHSVPPPADSGQIAVPTPTPLPANRSTSVPPPGWVDPLPVATPAVPKRRRLRIA